MRDDALVTNDESKAPTIPALTAAGLHYWYIWAVPYWITEFITFLVKDRLFEHGVSNGDWVILFFWPIFEVLGTWLGRRGLHRAEWVITSPIWLFILFAIVRCFLTGWIFKSCNTVLLIEQITSLITLTAQIVLILGTFISFIMSTKGIGVNPGEYQ
jgi:hypothetical protein